MAEHPTPEGDQDLTTGAWHRLEGLFEAACEVPADELETWIERRCGEDRWLGMRLRELLRADGRAAGNFLQLPSTLVSGLGADDPGEREPDVPESLGAYRIMGVLGQGGSSTVYLGERDDAFRKRVAIKVLRIDSSGGELSNRFLRERQILAGLDHPFIAKIVDGGETRSGSPYLVMDYVEGLPIDRYCDRNDLAVRQIIELFLLVIEAVDHAHRNLIVHRDIKAGNVLVRSDGQPRLLDFGIAKLLNADVIVGAESTRVDLLLMTPSYASPEQVRGQNVSVASDIYSLGVLLYRLLTGSSPYDAATENVLDVVNAVCEQRPMPASRRAAKEGRVERSRELRGDLDHILERALAKRPEDRYRSTDRLADDLRRWLRGEAVDASTGGAFYRAGKFLRRNRFAVLLTAGAVVLITAFMVQTVRQSIRVEKALEVAEAERGRANREAESARTVSQFLVDLFRFAEPGAVGGADLTALELLERGVEELESEATAMQPLTRATLRNTVGSVFWKMGLYREAEALHRQALEVQRKLLPEEDERLGTTLNALGLSLTWQGRYEEAAPIMDEAVAVREASLGSRHAGYAESLNDRGILFEVVGLPERAEPLYRRALEIRQNALGPEHALVGESHNNLACLLADLERFEEAEKQHLRAIDIRRTALGSRHPTLAESLNNAAAMYDDLERFGESEPMYREAVEIGREMLGPEHPMTATYTYNLASSLTKQGKLEEAGPMLESSLEAREKALGAEHPVVARTLYGLSSWHLARGDTAGALPIVRRSLAILEASVEPGHRWRVESARRLEQLETAAD